MFEHMNEDLLSAPVPEPRKKKRADLESIAFSFLLVLLLGVISWPSWPYDWNDSQRRKQKKSMGDMRSIGTAAESYAVDYNRYPASAASLPPGPYPSRPLPPSMVSSLEPTYIRKLPLSDGWGSPFLYRTTPKNDNYVIVSTGRDGIPGTFTLGSTTSFDADIVFSNGQFLQYPEGRCN